MIEAHFTRYVKNFLIILDLSYSAQIWVNDKNQSIPPKGFSYLFFLSIFIDQYCSWEIISIILSRTVASVCRIVLLSEKAYSVFFCL